MLGFSRLILSLRGIILAWEHGAGVLSSGKTERIREGDELDEPCLEASRMAHSVNARKWKRSAGWTMRLVLRLSELR